jgi:RNA polymerase sigma-70 factor (ECF subfamily)
VLRLPDLPERSAWPDDAAIGALDLRHALAGLGRQDRMVLYLFYFLDLPQDEVAQVMGISTAAVKARVHRAVQRLRPALGVEETPA